MSTSNEFQPHKAVAGISRATTDPGTEPRPQRCGDGAHGGHLANGNPPAVSAPLELETKEGKAMSHAASHLRKEIAELREFAEDSESNYKHHMQQAEAHKAEAERLRAMIADYLRAADLLDPPPCSCATAAPAEVVAGNAMEAAA
jgi:hypothetical protein